MQAFHRLRHILQRADALGIVSDQGVFRIGHYHIQHHLRGEPVLVAPEHTFPEQNIGIQRSHAVVVGVLPVQEIQLQRRVNRIALLLQDRHAVALFRGRLQIGLAVEERGRRPVIIRYKSGRRRLDIGIRGARLHTAEQRLLAHTVR